jgi:hypothetical protein
MRQDGYMTALSVMLSIILVSVTLYNIQILNSEREFIQTRISWLQTHTLLQIAREEVLEELRADQLRHGDQRTLTFSTGSVDYTVSEHRQDIFMIKFDVRGTEFGKGTGLLYYDYVNHIVFQWVVV